MTSSYFWGCPRSVEFIQPTIILTVFFCENKQIDKQLSTKFRVLDSFENAFAFGPHVNDVSGTKNAGSWKWSPEFNGPAGLSFWCGRKKTEVFEYDDVIHHTAHALYGMLSFFHCFSVSVWTGENDFSITERNVRFLKYPDTCERDQTWFEENAYAGGKEVNKMYYGRYEMNKMTKGPVKRK